ncbi:MAG TPA: hypothetical protein VNH53_05080 [Sphingomicrobium sp.]|nr:hypothetical protein [Sphingomicrobium sp.]
MKSEPKVFASLSSGLLARKGAARPAMRPQGFGQVGGGLDDLGWDDMGFEPPKPAVVPARDDEHDAFGEELPVQPLRNPIAALTPIGSPVHDQQAEIEDRLAPADDDIDEEYDETAELYDSEEEAQRPVAAVAMPAAVQAPAPRPRRAPRARSAPGSKGKAAFTLRLDPERHLKLRLACAVDGRSAQQVVTDALDQFLAAVPELDAMAEKAKRKG